MLKNVHEGVLILDLLSYCKQTENLKNKLNMYFYTGKI